MKRLLMIRTSAQLSSFVSSPSRPRCLIRCWLFQALHSCLCLSGASAFRLFGSAYRATSLSLASTNVTMSARLDSPSAQRNKEVIWEVLREQVLKFDPATPRAHLRILEIAAGAGVHSRFFCEKLLAMDQSGGAVGAADEVTFIGTPRFESIQWFPTDPNEEMRRSIGAYRDDDISRILQLPLALTLNDNGVVETDIPLEDGSFDLIVCINMIHISPWEATVGLMKAAQRFLKPGSGMLFCYGPYRENGTAVESNLSFEKWLKSMDPEYGLRNLEDVVTLFESSNQLKFIQRVEMPANNLSILFRCTKE